MKLELKKTLIASRLNINVKIVVVQIRREREEGNLVSKKGKSRKRCTSNDEDKKIVDYVKDHPLTTRAEIKQQVKVNCSISTIKRK